MALKGRAAANLLFAEYLPSMAKGFKARPPETVRIDVAATCNLRCRHCPTGIRYGDRSVSRGLMGEDVFDQIVTQIAKVKSLKGAIFYLSGEPLMHPNLPDFLTRIKRETWVRNTAFVTNGMLVDGEICRKLSHVDVDRISISIDGRSPEENDFIRRGSSYEKVREQKEPR